jgi:hypothetical protein
MKKFSKMRQTLLLSTMVLTLTIGLASTSAFAAEGDILATVMCAETSVTAAYDGTTIWHMKGTSSTDMDSCSPAGVDGPTVPILGLMAGDSISGLTYDGTRDLLYGASNDNGGGSRNIYEIDRTTGVATFMFPLISAGAGLTDGFAYDGQDDSLWISGDVSATIDHYTILGAPIATAVPIPVPPGAMAGAPTNPFGFDCGNSGIAAGVDILYLGWNGCTIVSKHMKSDLSFIAEFVVGGAGRVEDLTCDPNTFPGVDAIWTKDAFDPDIFAVEVPDGTCPLGGGGIIVAGELLPIDSAALMIAGLQTSAIWMLPILAGAVGTGAFIVRSKLK